MKHLPTDLRELEKRTRLLHGKWRVTERIMTRKAKPGESDYIRVVVEIWYDGQFVFDSHGHVALEAALANVERWIKIGHIPQIQKAKAAESYTQSSLF